MKTFTKKYDNQKFEKMDIYDQCILLFTNCDVLMVVKKEDGYYSLYAYNDFFVEVKFDKKNFQIIHVKQLGRTKLPDHYLSEIVLPSYFN